jgi:hypothetical protein
VICRIAEHLNQHGAPIDEAAADVACDMILRFIGV